jgi:hypothetical protein
LRCLYGTTTALNILLTSVGNVDNPRHQSIGKDWQARHHIVETIPAERLLGYLRLTSASLAQIDVIVCNADLNPDSTPTPFALDKAVRIANEVADLPEFIAMRDGRKWRMIPFVIIGEKATYFEQVSDLKAKHASVIRPNPYTDNLLSTIQSKVDDYHQRLFEEYEYRGMMVRIVKGRTQISPAMQAKKRHEESEYYYVPADRRKHARNKWLTVMRDREGISADVALLEELINTNANEQAMQRFFEEHPALLMQARLGIPVAHPTFTTPRRYSPDFAMTPILGAAHGDSAEFLELKGPDAPLLNNVKRHQGLSRALHVAIDQVRDYGRYLSNPENAARLIKKLGYLPTTPRLAVLIGRDLRDAAQDEALRRRETEAVNVKIITYDEILEGQAKQLSSRLVLPGDDDFPDLGKLR